MLRGSHNDGARAVSIFCAHERLGAIQLPHYLLKRERTGA